VRDGENGFLLPPTAPTAAFARQLDRLRASRPLTRRFGTAALATAAEFSRERCAKLALKFYEEVGRDTRRERLLTGQNPWLALGERIGVEWEILSRNARAVTTALAS